MKTTNWQTKALTLFTAAVALWLTAACGNAAPTIETEPVLATTATPTGGPTQPPTVAAPTPRAGCTHETPVTRSWLNTTEAEYVESLSDPWWFSRDVRDKYKDLFWRQPNVYDVGIGQMRDNQGELTPRWGITVWVTEKVNQATLPSEDRIPDLLEDVQIRIVEAEPQQTPESNCDYSQCGLTTREGEKNMTNPNSYMQEDRAERARRQARALKLRDKYLPLFKRQPNVYSTSVGRFRDENDELTGASGIIVSVTKKVDQSTLPPEDRIPDCLEGIPVQIREKQPLVRVVGSTEKGDN